jgi:hypothetical protein
LSFWIALGLTAATIVLALLLLRSGDRGPAGRFLLTLSFNLDSGPIRMF